MAAVRRIVRGNRLPNIWREGALFSKMGEKGDMCPLIFPFLKWRETDVMTMAAAVRRIVRGKQMTEKMAGRGSRFQNGGETGDAPHYVANAKMAGNVRRGNGNGGQTYSNR